MDAIRFKWALVVFTLLLLASTIVADSSVPEHAAEDTILVETLTDSSSDRLQGQQVLLNGISGSRHRNLDFTQVPDSADTPSVAAWHPEQTHIDNQEVKDEDTVGNADASALGHHDPVSKVVEQVDEEAVVAQDQHDGDHAESASAAGHGGFASDHDLGLRNYFADQNETTVVDNQEGLNAEIGVTRCMADVSVYTGPGDITTGKACELCKRSPCLSETAVYANAGTGGTPADKCACFAKVTNVQGDDNAAIGCWSKNSSQPIQTDWVRC